jgi:peptide/nickel transport system substrate-binding protein
METLYNRIRALKILNKLPEVSKINAALFSFSKKERLIFSGLVVVLILSTILILNTINRHFMVTMPMYGGSITEGIIGTPRFINPVLANSIADQDLVSLIYSGLMRKNSDGDLVPDLAEKYDISNDGLTYTFTLKDDIYFHDDEPVTVDDIIFTIETVKDSIIKSPHKANWDGIAVSKIDEKTVEFSLKQPYASFLENTTLGIMPAHLWSDTPIELSTVNTTPVGSGPYMINNVNKQASGTIDYYELKSFKKFALGEPYIKNITLYFYSNEDDLVKALQNKEVDQISSITPSNAERLRGDGYRIESAILPRVFGLFFNQNNNQIFLDKTVISAINQAIDKDKIVSEVLSGYGVVIDEPIPPSMIQYQKVSDSIDLSREEILQKVEKSLADDGWEKNSEGFLEKTTQEKTTSKGKTVAGKKTTKLLEFSISTSDAPELAKAAALIQSDLTAIGMKVDIQTFEVNSLNQDVIRPRKYDALLFGQIINNESDLFAFWHSSQRLDPGLNIAMYTNATVDKILEDAFVTINKDSRVKKYIQFENEIKKDMPAVFLYTPNFIYIVPENLMGISMDNITFPSNRFSDVYLWYTEKYNVWKIFAN